MLARVVFFPWIEDICNAHERGCITEFPPPPHLQKFNHLYNTWTRKYIQPMALLHRRRAECQEQPLAAFGKHVCQMEKLTQHADVTMMLISYPAIICIYWTGLLCLTVPLAESVPGVYLVSFCAGRIHFGDRHLWKKSIMILDHSGTRSKI